MSGSGLTESVDDLMAQAAQLDAQDGAVFSKQHFALPDNVVYLDGNSLGPPTVWLSRRVSDLISHQWSQDLIQSWSRNGWWDAPTRVGDRIAPLIGAGKGEVVVGDSTSVHLFNALCAACRLTEGRELILIDQDDFPTDRYIAHSVGMLLGLTVVEAPSAEFAGRIRDYGSRLAVVLASAVDYRSAELRDMSLLTELTHSVGAATVWDLSHAVGAMPLDVHGLDTDFAVGCTYKFLSGGPGSPAFLYVAERIADRTRFPLTGWNGHADPFAMSAEWQPHYGVRAGRIGTPAILAMAGLEAALEVFDRVTLAEVRAKSVSLTSFFIRSYDQLLPDLGFELASPRDPDSRGSHISLRHERAENLVETLADSGVIVDYRQPALLRFGFNALFNTHQDALTALSVLNGALAEGAFGSTGGRAGAVMRKNKERVTPWDK